MLRDPKVPIALLVSSEETPRGVDVVYVCCSLFTLFENPRPSKDSVVLQRSSPGFEGERLVIAPRY